MTRVARQIQACNRGCGRCRIDFDQTEIFCRVLLGIGFCALDQQLGGGLQPRLRINDKTGLSEFACIKRNAVSQDFDHFGGRRTIGQFGSRQGFQ